jgi:RNA polymerase sigma-B factor
MVRTRERVRRSRGAGTESAAASEKDEDQEWSMPTATRTSRSNQRQQLLACDDTELFQQLRHAAPQRADAIREVLVKRHGGLVGWLVGQYAHGSVEAEDLRQVGFVGLVLAIDRFDVDRGHEFSSFARPTVQGEIRRYFRDKRRWIRMPRRLQEAKATLRTVTETLTHELHRTPTDAELAKHSGLPETLVTEAMAAEDNFSPVSLDAPSGHDGDETFTVADTVGESDPRIEFLLDCAALRPLLARLPERERRVLHLRYYLEKTQAQIGHELGCSQMQVSRILSRIHDRLRPALLGELPALG